MVSALLYYIGLWIAESGKREFLWFFFEVDISITVLLSAFILLIVKLVLDSTRTKGLRIVLLAGSYWIIAVLGRTFVLHETQLPFLAFAVIQGSALGLMYEVYAKPLVPQEFTSEHLDNRKERREALKVHLTTYWRVGQITLTLMLLIIAGLVWAFPRGGTSTARIRLTVMGTVFIVTFGPVLLFVLRKHFVVENEVLTTFTDIEESQKNPNEGKDKKDNVSRNVKQTWRDVLEIIYDETITFDEPPDRDKENLSSEKQKETIEKISDKTDQDEDTVRDALRYLRNVRLIDDLEMGGSGGPYGLTEEGFSVAHEWESRKKEQTHREKLRERQQVHEEEIAERQMKHQQRLNIFTAALVAVAGIQAFVAISSISLPNSTRLWISVGLGLVVGIVGTFFFVSLWGD